jgi:hypothetical protein
MTAIQRVMLSATTDQPPASSRALRYLTPLGWWGGIAAVVAGMALSFVLFGYFAIYWRNADMDFMVVYNALILNAGKPQEFFDHPAYLTILSVEYAFRALHAVGLLDAASLPDIPSAANVPAFDAAMTHAIRVGRLVALATAMGVVVIFAQLMRRVVRDWRVAGLATFAFAFSGGVAVHERILRSDLVAASFVMFALLIVIDAARRGSVTRPLALGIAAACCVLGLENKVQVIVLIATLPVLGLLFGARRGASAAFWRESPRAWPAALAMVAVAAVLIWLAWPILMIGFDPVVAREAGLRPLLRHTFGTYQVALAVYAVLAMIAFAFVWRVSAGETLATMAAIAGGAALGLLALDIQFNAGDAVAVLNPVEKMLTFAPSEAGGDVVMQNIAILWGSILSVLQRYSFVLYTSARPTVFLLWLVVAGIVLAWVRSERQLAVQALLLVLIAACIDTLGVSRGLKSEYFVYSDPLIIIAGALLLDRFPDVSRWRGAFVTGLLLMVMHILVIHSEPMKMMTKKSGPEYICDWNQIYEPQLPLPWCALPPVRS